MTRLRHQTGFTLLELLIAIAIFALVAVMAYGGLNTVIHHSGIIRSDTRAVLATQQGLKLLRQDLRYAVDRPVRDALGSPVPAFISGQYQLFSTTRMGMANPWMQPRAQLARVTWRLKGDRLERAVQMPVDGQVNSTTATPDWVIVLRHVTALKATFFDDKNQAFSSWPPPNQPSAGLPHAVQLLLTLGQMPPMRMTVPMISDWPTTAAGTTANGQATSGGQIITGRDQENKR